MSEPTMGCSPHKKNSGSKEAIVSEMQQSCAERVRAAEAEPEGPDEGAVAGPVGAAPWGCGGCPHRPPHLPLCLFLFLSAAPPLLSCRHLDVKPANSFVGIRVLSPSYLRLVCEIINPSL